MTGFWLGIAAFGLLLINLVATGSLVRSIVRQAARERATLIDQIMHLAGRTWTPPPAEPVGEPYEDDLADPRFELNPANLLDY